MTENEDNKIKLDDSITDEEAKKSEECLKDSIKFENFCSPEEAPKDSPKEETATQSVSLEEYEKVKKDLLDTTERLKRALADFENYKKRVIKEKEDLQKYANETLLKDMLETADNLELTLFHSRQLPDVNEELIKGFEMTVKGFLDMLKRYGVNQIDTSNKTFDPNIHDAIAAVESETIPAGEIIKIERKGYTLFDRLLRPAYVVVSKGKPSPKIDEKHTEEKEVHKCIAEPEPTDEQKNE